MSARASLGILLYLGFATACPADRASFGGETGTAGASTGAPASDESTGDGSVDLDTSGEGGSGVDTGVPPITCDSIEPGGLVPEEPVVAADCEPLITCRKDSDFDGVPSDCDNAWDTYNPAQRDIDGDGYGEPEDLCPMVATELQDVDDLDADGYGNACDNCPLSPVLYNAALSDSGVPFGAWVRNVPHQRDTDGDGVGDACDNCPTVANCGTFGPDAPATVLDEPPTDDPAQCQTDADLDGIGDACQGTRDPDAAGTVGFAAEDDFDQDGIANAHDGCPRLWHEADVCTRDDDCAGSGACNDGRCDHPDADGDGIADACDTCPEVPNPGQVVSAHAAILDDGDRDFVGAACELGADCSQRGRSRPLGFFDVVAEGQCCVRTWPTTTLYDQYGVQLAADCGDEPSCREVPAEVAAARTSMPTACEVALAEACREEASMVTLDDVGGDLVALWAYVCQLPPLDQDVDGIGDRCDRCPFRHDPSNAPFVDAEGNRWEQDGAACTGEYSLSSLDPATGCVPGT